MKTIKIFFSVAFLSLVTTIGANAQTTTQTKRSTTVQPARSINNPTNNATSIKEIKTTSGTNGNVNANKNDAISNAIQPNNNASNIQLERRSTMYKTVVMNDDQVRRYETEYNNVMANWKKSNPNKVMTSAEMAEYNNSILRPILNDTQYSTYEQWYTGYPNN